MCVRQSWVHRLGSRQLIVERRWAQLDELAVSRQPESRNPASLSPSILLDPIPHSESTFRDAPEFGLTAERRDEAVERRRANLTDSTELPRALGDSKPACR